MKKRFVLFMAAAALTGRSGWPDGRASQSAANNRPFDQKPSFY
ncbi:MAG: hypothetical protein ABF760_02495 [Zymomonas mobilis]|uniref:Uncharacterized protein n=1 Tax=Zymomonas mobilis TaxID=542 RepID=A0A542W2Y5_ZYMMB|nr:hypothetical protein [Zymomonas mobilis]TQL17940.1 hypothetical protein FBY58_1553 [Zymomonas mobilis]